MHLCTGLRHVGKSPHLFIAAYQILKIHQLLRSPAHYHSSCDESNPNGPKINLCRRWDDESRAALGPLGSSWQLYNTRWKLGDALWKLQWPEWKDEQSDGLVDWWMDEKRAALTGASAAGVKGLKCTLSSQESVIIITVVLHKPLEQLRFSQSNSLRICGTLLRDKDR